MPVHPEFDPGYLYFVTSAAVGHLPLFRDESVAMIILDSLSFLRENKRVKLYAFVIMPSHMDVAAQFTQEYTLVQGVRDLKRHTARRIIGHLQSTGQVDRLARLHQLNRDTRQVFQVWEEGYDAREVFSPGFLEQKLNYIHYNPCQQHWNLACLPEQYRWSSARYYILDEGPAIPIDDARAVFL